MSSSTLFRRPWLYGAAAVVVAALAYGTYALVFAKPAMPSYVTATVQRADIEDAVLASGTLEAFRQVSVGAQVSGQIKSLKVDVGDEVRKGQLIAEIDSLPQTNSLRNAEAALATARAQWRARQAEEVQAEQTYKRQQVLRAADASSQADFEAAEATLNTVRAGVEALKAQVAQAEIAADTARINLGYTRIVSPMDGHVVAIVTKEGQTVNANQSAPTIVKIAQLDTMTIKAQISEADVVRVLPGQKAYFTVLGEPDRRYDATLRSVDPAPESLASESSSSSSSSDSAASAKAIYYNGVFEVPNPERRLRISMTAQVRIVRAEARDALSIPSSALGARGRDGAYTVRVLDAEGRVQRREIKVGLNNSVNAQVLEGLEAGERVVLGEAAAGTSPAANTRMPRGMRL